MALIERGQVDLTDISGDTYRLKTGKYFGDGMLRFGTPSPFSAVAVADSSLWIIKRSDWLAAKELTFVSGSSVDIGGSRTRAGGVQVGKPKTTRAPTTKIASLFVKFLAITMIVFFAFALTAYMMGDTLIQYSNQAATQMALNAGRVDLAEEYLSLAAVWQPSSAQLYDQLGYVRFLQGKQSDALAAFEYAVRLDATLASARNNLGVAYLQQNAPTSAVPHFKAAVELDPGNADAFANLGNAYLASGDFNSAASAFQRSFQLDPDQLTSKSLYAGIALKDGKFYIARLNWEQILAVDPGNGSANRGLGVLDVLEGDPVGGLLHLEAARNVDPLDPTTRLYLGLAYEALERKSEAVVEYESVLALSDDPEFTEFVKAHLLAILQ